MTVDRVYACQRACFPSAGQPPVPEAESCCYNPGSSCGKLGVIGNVHWVRYWSNTVASESRGCGDVPRRGTSRGWESSGCRWEFVRETDGALVVDVHCEFSTGGEGEVQQDVPCPERTQSPCERWTDAHSTVATASCRERFPLELARWPRVELPACQPTDGQAVLATRTRPRTCGHSNHETLRRCEARDRVGTAPVNFIDVAIDGVAGLKRTTPLPCPVGSVSCEEHEKLTWDLTALQP